MPELPEVEAARQIAEDHFVGKTIVQVNAVEDESELFLFWPDRLPIDGDDDGGDDLVPQPQPSTSFFHYPPPEIFAGASPESLRSALVGKKVTAARRHGKNLWLELEQGGGGSGSSSYKGKKGKAAPKASSPPPSSSSSSPSSAALMLHFGMTGSFPVRGAKRVAYVNEGGGARKAEEEEGEQGEGAAAGASASPPRPQWPPRFCKIELSLSPGDVRVAFCDPRRFGRVQLVRPASAVAARLPAGRDVLNDPLSPRDLAEALGKVNKGKAGRALKTVLMEQSFLAGVGNWVADEVRWEGRGKEKGLREESEGEREAEKDDSPFFKKKKKKKHKTLSSRSSSPPGSTPKPARASSPPAKSSASPFPSAPSPRLPAPPGPTRRCSPRSGSSTSAGTRRGPTRRRRTGGTG